MNRQAFKQRMQNLKSYRENNPGKGYWDWKVEAFADGGQTGDPEKERFYQATGRSSSGRPLEEGLKPVFSIEDAANMTPIGDAISARDAYNAVKNRDWLGAGLAALTVIPGEARGKMQTQGSATIRHKEGGDFPKIGEYDYMFNIDRGVPYGGTTHEINHFSDFLKNQSPDAVGSSNMYKWMRSAIKPYSDSVSKYFSSPTEQKAYMNQLREFMYANKMIDTRDQVVTPSLIKTALDKLPKGMDSVKKASDQFKSLKSYTKWFNTVPLLGVGAIGANKYFTNNESRN